ncbi:MAG: LytTR family DNA-binding domain-containing protein [Bacteroidota bacterium]
MHVLIVEDEVMVARRLERLVRSVLGARLHRVEVRHTLAEARAYLKHAPIDVLFLDLNLNGRDGFELLKSILSDSFRTVIVSAHTDQALRAFDEGVFDFIGKPFGEERLRRTMERLEEAQRQGGYARRYLPVQKAGRVDLVKIDQIRYIRGADSYAELHLADGSRELHSATLDHLERTLPPVFERIHRSYLVNMAGVSHLLVETGTRYAVVLASGERLPVGRTRYKRLRARLST